MRRLAGGGMADVYLAKHEFIDKFAAVKVLNREMSARQGIVKRFFQEAQAAAQIEHPGIVNIFDVGYTSEGRAYLVMELLRGETLGDRLKREGRLSAAATLALMRQLAGVMAVAHRCGIVHRDLKPGNLFVVPDPEMPRGERIKVLDFGLAKLAESAVIQTAESAVFGTPAYMAPEQTVSSAKVDERADLYSMGCIFYACLCGAPPFGSSGLETLMGHLNMPPAPPRRLEPSIPPELDALVMALLEKDPARRMGSCEALIAALDGDVRTAVPEEEPPCAAPAVELDRASARTERLSEPTTAATDEDTRVPAAAAGDGGGGLVVEGVGSGETTTRMPMPEVEASARGPGGARPSAESSDERTESPLPPLPRRGGGPERSDGPVHGTAALPRPAAIVALSMPDRPTWVGARAGSARVSRRERSSLSLGGGELAQPRRQRSAREKLLVGVGVSLLGGVLALGLVLEGEAPPAVAPAIQADAGPGPTTTEAEVAGGPDRASSTTAGPVRAAAAGGAESATSPEDEAASEGTPRSSDEEADAGASVGRDEVGEGESGARRRSVRSAGGSDARGDEARPEAGANRARAAQFLGQAKQSYRRGRLRTGLHYCQQSWAAAGAEPDPDIAGFCGFLACKAGARVVARRYYRRAVGDTHRGWIAQTCLQAGIDVQ
ncbi:protein kinase domain-containing protein [Haliangium sp.]|uniref:serine/threonine-protein kinase n=1 Tax=Haliangium sp. TaxID=2663208 RepID=UPI003D0FDCD3